MIKKACNEIVLTAKTYRLPSQFLLRLIWRESRFDPQAVSPAGAQGIAQFMPATAQWRGLEDPFDWSLSIQHSGRWLSELRQQFGNLGLAAAAYNAGPGRVRDWLAGTRELPDETRAYVHNVTGRTADDWIALKDSDKIVDVDAECPPPGSRSVTALRAAPRQQGAPTEANAKSTEPPTSKSRPGPWALQLIGDRSKSSAVAQYANLRQKFPTILGPRAPEIVSRRIGGRLPTFWYQIRVSEASRQRATTLCTRLKSAGGECVVIPN
ncbi:lytic transglycosylase domain-containing protein [Rhodoblastus sp.]|uniref:lytic transglycosylase domain-containing protein n=1 Tax=Rhodoblastus sp. TaxID=1962975 RepID=UPI0035B3B29F